MIYFYYFRFIYQKNFKKNYFQCSDLCARIYKKIIQHFFNNLYLFLIKYMNNIKFIIDWP